jgi:FdhD protein
LLAAEEPLGIRVDGTALTMTMRTPGDDLELAAGFLVSEAVVGSPADIAGIKLCDGTACGHGDHGGLGNIADVTLAEGVTVAPGARRTFMTTSACGICGKASIQDICVLPHTALAGIRRASLRPCWPCSLDGCATRSGCSRAPAACTPPGCSPPRAS